MAQQKQFGKSAEGFAGQGELFNEVEEIVEPGELDPDQIHTPGIYVNRLVLGTFEKRIEQRTSRS